MEPHTRRTLYHFALTVCAGLLCLSASAAPDGTVTRRAVCVGISDYVGSGNDLSYCDDDARDFAAALAVGDNWSAGNVVVIVDRQATAANIWAALNNMAGQSDEDDQCLFFFSGHGSRGSDVAPLDEGGGYDEYLVESDMNNNIRDDVLGDWVAGLPTDNFLAVLCSCFSGGFIKGVDGAKGLGPADPIGTAANDFAADVRAALARRQQMQPADIDDAGRGAVLTASDENETCQESSELGHDVFNHYLLQGMAGPADSNGNDWVTAEEMYAYANPRATTYNPGQHAQIYDANPGTPFQLLNLGAPVHTVAITNGPWGTPDVVEPGGQMVCHVIAQDSLGGALEYEWTVTNNAGTLDDPSAAGPTWTAPANNSGHTREYTVTVVVSAQTDPAVSDEGSFTARVMTTLTHDFPAGVSMISLPGTIQAGVLSMEGIVGASKCVTWDGTAQAYGPVGPPTPVPAEGQGCWAQFDTAQSVQLIGLTSVDDTFVGVARAPWDIIALPWNENVHITGMTSVPDGRLAQAAWTYHGGEYHLVANVEGIAGVTDELEPWRAYWVNATVNCNVQLDRTVTPAAVGAAKPASADWSIRLIASADDGTAAAAWCGVSSAEGVTIASPPPPASGVDLRVQPASGAGRAVDLSASPGASSYEWRLTAAGAPEGARVTLACADLSAVPAQYRVYLVDEDAGRRVSMRTARAYSYTATDAPRHLTLQVVSGADATLTLAGVTAQHVKGGAATISYTLSAPADVTVAVHNIAGRVIAVLQPGQDMGAGVQSASWNLRGTAGALVPAGMYLVRVTARAEDGAEASALATLAVRR